MAKCQGKTVSGKPCGMKTKAGARYCFTHDPAMRAAQAAARKRGGEARHTPHFADPSRLPQDVTNLEDARRILSYTLAEVAGMDNSIARARVLLALFDSYVKSIEVGEIEQRLAALEAKQK